MKVLVCGSRTWDDQDAVTERLADLPENAEVLHGGAEGADICAYWACLGMGITARTFLPDYKTHGRSAPHVRNDKMLDQADAVIAFWDGESRGTASVIDKARRRNIPVEIVSTTSDAQASLPASSGSSPVSGSGEG